MCHLFAVVIHRVHHGVSLTAWQTEKVREIPKKSFSVCRFENLSLRLVMEMMCWNLGLSTKVNDMEVSAVSSNLLEGNGKRTQISLRILGM